LPEKRNKVDVVFMLRAKSFLYEYAGGCLHATNLLENSNIVFSIPDWVMWEGACTR